jgi:two-component system sensor kinase FixL
MTDRKPLLRKLDPARDVDAPVEESELRRTRQQLEDREARLKAILDTVVDGVVTIDEHGNIESVNKATEQIFGYSSDELVGENVSILMPSPHREAHDTYIADYLHTGRKKIIGIGREVEGRRKDGSHFPIDLAVSEVRFDDTLLFTGLIRDISRRRTAEEQARLRLEELAHAGRLSIMGELATGIAHEVNQPLAAIVSFAEACLRMVRSGATSTEKIENALEQIAGQGHRAGEIIRHLRRLVQKDSGAQSPDALNRIVNDVLGLVVNDLSRHDIRLSTVLAEELPAIRCYRIQIEQVLLNLVRNAMEAMETRASGERLLTIRTGRQGENHVELTVEDTGKGFAVDDADRIFETFYSTKEDSLGMGLAISRSIIEEHGGRLWASERPGGGAVFHLSLPIHQEGAG